MLVLLVFIGSLGYIIMHRNMLMIALHFLAILAYVIVIMAFLPFDVGRALNLVMASLAPFVFAEIVCGVLGEPGIFFALSTFTIMIVSKGVNRDSGFPLILALVTLLVQFMYALALGSVYSFCIRCIFVGLAFVCSYLTIHGIDSLGRRYGLDILKLANAWSSYILTRDGSSLERVFMERSVDYRAIARCLLFESDEMRIAFIVPGVHFGPFGRIGSALLPYQLDLMLERCGVKSFVLHGVGSHELNIASSTQSAEFAKKVRNYILNRSAWIEVELYKPFRVVDGGRDAFVIPTSKNSFIAISSPIIGGDDLPRELQSVADRIARMYGIEGATIIDCHNLEGEKIDSVEPFIPIIVKALSTSTTKCKEFKVGYGEDLVHGKVRGLCSNRVKVFALECNGSKYGLVYLYGNNARIGVREALRRQLIKLGFSDAEVVTADDHLCAALTFDAPYFPVELNENLIRTVESAARKALASLRPARAWFLEIPIETKIMGDCVYQMLRVTEGIARYVVNKLKLFFAILNAVAIGYALLSGLHLI